MKHRRERGPARILEDFPVGSVRRRLLLWYRDRARPLPWRSDTNAYRVWVAEAMLQQTRVAVVERAYPGFLRRFPTLRALAAASEEEVLSAWSGLGYYARARRLREAARWVVERHGGRFPRDFARARSLPGVGPYTAAAVLSCAYGLPHAAVDSNVRRVLGRLAGEHRAGSATVRELAAVLLDRERPGQWNQALMELGETVCLPRAPKCPSCPLRRHCRAYASGGPSVPARAARPGRERIFCEVYVVRDRHGFFLLERGAFRYLPHLWLPPVVLSGEPPLLSAGTPKGTFRHAIVRRDFVVEVLEARLRRSEIRAMAERRGAEWRLFRPGDLEKLGRSSFLSKALALAGVEASFQPARRSAMQSISTLAPRASAAQPTVIRAGGFSGKNSR
ncbi:MAG: A/G-specific adenine glycosylase [Candidatus Binatia bacterium]|nr:MAG: A/G-specific adenine glycosylase [Candidatus Binatia bacterium]